MKDRVMGQDVVRRMYPDAGLVEPKGEFRNTLLETVRELFPKLPGR